MCFMIREETNDTFHSALGSSGRFLEGKEMDSGYLPRYSNITEKLCVCIVTSLQWKVKSIPYKIGMFGVPF